MITTLRKRIQRKWAGYLFPQLIIFLKILKLFILNGTDEILKSKVKAYIIKNVTHPYGFLAHMTIVY